MWYGRGRGGGIGNKKLCLESELCINLIKIMKKMVIFEIYNIRMHKINIKNIKIKKYFMIIY